MLHLRTSLLGLALLCAAAALVGCQTAPRQSGCLPGDLPTDPDPCTKYCRVWVPPVYRDVPYVVEVCPARTVQVPEEGMETRYQEVCTKPRETYDVCTPDRRCDQVAVQTKPGGYVWKRDPCGDCWNYCYEPPTFQWCNKTVTEQGITYCTEIPPEYSVEVTHEPVTRCRTVYVPAQYETRWEKELFTPGRWEWQPSKLCADCDCPAPGPEIPFRALPCEPVTTGCPTTN